MAEALGALPAMAMTHTCYNGVRPPCGTCPACELRAKGFAEAGIDDPLTSRLPGRRFLVLPGIFSQFRCDQSLYNFSCS